MTRREFIEDVTTWDALRAFCYDEDCDICEDIYSADEYDERVEEDIGDRSCNWYDLAGYLSDLPSPNDYDAFRYNGWLDYDGVDDGDSEFDDYKDRILEWMDDGDWWEEDEEDEVDEEDYDWGDTVIEEDSSSDEDMEVDEAFSVDSLFSNCCDAFRSITIATSEREAAEIKENAAAFAAFMSACV